MLNYPRIAHLLARGARAGALATGGMVAVASLAGDAATTPGWLQIAVRLLALGTLALFGSWAATVGMIAPEPTRTPYQRRTAPSHAPHTRRERVATN